MNDYARPIKVFSSNNVAFTDNQFDSFSIPYTILETSGSHDINIITKLLPLLFFYIYFKLFKQNYLAFLDIKNNIVKNITIDFGMSFFQVYNGDATFEGNTIRDIKSVCPTSGVFKLFFKLIYYLFSLYFIILILYLYNRGNDPSQSLWLLHCE